MQQEFLNLDLEGTQKKLDKALKRNLQSQNVQVVQKAQETTTEELPEPIE